MRTNYVRRASHVLMLGLMLLAASTSAHAANGKYDEVIQRMLTEGRDDFPVIVRYKDNVSKERNKKALKGQRAQLRREMKQLRAMGLKTNRASLLAMLADSGVEGVSYDAPVSAFQLPSLPPVPVSIDASGSKSARNRYGVTGSGVTVAVIDSGVQPSADLPASRIRGFVDFVNGQTQPYDDYGHGTHVANIIAGNGLMSGGQYTGAAPDASIVGLKVLDANGGGATSNVLAALDWVLLNHAAYNIRIVNLSLGHSVYEAAATDPLVQAVEELTKRGVVVVVASGNLGRDRTTGTLYYGSVTSPGNAPSALTVGAVNTNGTSHRSDDFVADFSGRGPTRFDRLIKPDVVAPGYAIMAKVADGSTLATKYPSLVNEYGYMRLNGTSMATPAVAGAAALVLSANPGLTAHTVKAVLQYTAQRLPAIDVMNQGAGEVNMAGAVRLAKLINPAAAPGKNWLKTSGKPTRADLLYGEVAAWGRATIWGAQVHVGQNMYLKLAQWDDNIVWGFDENIVWGFDENIVWGFDENIVWGFDENIVWGFTDENIVWGFMDESIVPSATDNIVWGFTDTTVLGVEDNIVWGFNEIENDNIVWGFMDESDNIVWGFSEGVL
jgi:serine protease AprX